MIRKSYRTRPWASFDDAKNLEHHVYKGRGPKLAVVDSSLKACVESLS